MVTAARPAGTASRWYRPSAADLAPNRVPITWTVAPASGVPAESVTYPTTRPVPLGKLGAPACAAAPAAASAALPAISATARTTECIIPPVNRGCLLREQCTIGHPFATVGLRCVAIRRPSDHERFTPYAAVRRNESVTVLARRWRRRGLARDYGGSDIHHRNARETPCAHLASPPLRSPSSRRHSRRSA